METSPKKMPDAEAWYNLALENFKDRGLNNLSSNTKKLLREEVDNCLKNNAAIKASHGSGANIVMPFSEAFVRVIWKVAKVNLKTVSEIEKKTRSLFGRR